MHLPPSAPFATRPRPLCAALRKALRPSPQSAVLALGLVAVQSPVLGQSLELSFLDGSNGYVLSGHLANDHAGVSVSGIGDVNGDGIDDVIVGASEADPGGRADAGKSYVVFGRTEPMTAALELSALNGTNGFVLNGIDAGDASGASVSGAGDVNGDGIDDLVIGAPNADRFLGETYVVFGRTNGFSSVLELSALAGSDGFVLRGADAGDYAGSSVSGAGDVNGDGIDDLLVGAPGGDPYSYPNPRSNAGETYVVFGRKAGFDSVLDLANMAADRGFVVNGVSADDASGHSVSDAGDVNGDGVDDLIIGAPNAEFGPYSGTTGVSYVVFGRKEDGFAAVLELSALNGLDGFALNGANADDRAGQSVSGAGDINGDGVDDLLIGADGVDGVLGTYGLTDSGASYVVFGRMDGFDAPVFLSTLDGTNGFAVVGASQYDQLGRSVSGAGDISGDGIDDLLIGAPYADASGTYAPDTGNSYVVFGRTGASEPLIVLSGLSGLSGLDGSEGFTLKGVDAHDNSGTSVSGAGDINGDGIDDLLIGAPRSDIGSEYDAGEAYVVFGTPGPALVCRSTPGLAIPDDSVSRISTSLSTFGTSLLADLDVEIRATHTWVGDLIFALEQTSGFSGVPPVRLINRPGVRATAFGCDGDDIDAALDDEAVLPVEDECAPTTPTIAGTFTPNEPLSFFDGVPIAGTWTLSAFDIEPDETGTLDEWCLIPWYQPRSPCEAVDLPLIRVAFEGVETCIGESSLTARDTRVAATADVIFQSPIVRLGPGFQVETGAIFSVDLPPP